MLLTFLTFLLSQFTDFKDLKKKLNNKILFEKFKKHTEPRRVLKGWKYIEESTLNNIIAKYKENINQTNINQTNVDSDCEEM